MKLRSPIFTALAAIYAESQAGRTGRGTMDVQPSWSDLEEKLGHRLEGEEYDLALAELRRCDGTILKLEWDHPRARTTLHKIRLSPAHEGAFFDALGLESPTALRARWSALFEQAATWPVDVAYEAEWRDFCIRRAEQSRHWEEMPPFRQRNFREAEPLLDTTARLLAWRGCNLVRWVSSFLCADSKRLERRRGTLEALVREASGGRIADFASHGILPMPREAEVAGPLQLRIAGRLFDCEAQEVATLSLADLERAALVHCAAARCLTVENKTVFHDLTRKGSGDLIIRTSFPNAATLALIALLPATIEFWHFGDTDPSGFHILEDLRRRSGRPFRPFRMEVRPRAATRLLTAAERQLLTRLAHSLELVESRQEIAALLEAGTVGAFEQEEHQPAPLGEWPFY
ncbi:MAG TPA: Wadjet anti-phage system protein JetD domain-containing protein [Chthoniobacteraceae bacterium]|nr:Wadjet anti-phage system protein JetD domain-containing protein [Chthoniobacteraceae bacterium]